MRYLRMLSNSIVAALLAACYLVVLVLQLNPLLPLEPASLLPLARTIGLYYAVHLTAIFYVLLVVRQLFARELLSPAWLSVGIVSWLGAAASAIGAALMLVNLSAFSLVLEPPTTRAVMLGAAALAGSSVLFILVAVSRRSIGPPVVWLACLAMVAAGSVAAPLAWRGRGRVTPLEARPLDAALDARTPERVPRVTMIAIDAGSLELVTTAAAEGRLPNFGRMLDAGAVMHLATLQPTSPEVVWAAVATGKLPQKNGVWSSGVYVPAGGGDPIRLLPDFVFANGVVRLGLLTEQAYTSATIRARTLWGILSASGITVGVVNWPLTYPAPSVRGYVVSDLYARLAPTLSGLDDPSMLYPPELHAEMFPVMQNSAVESPVSVIGVGSSAVIPERHRSPGRTDRLYDRLARALSSSRPTQITITRYQSLDPIGHYFLRYASPSRFGDVSEDERREYGSVLEGHYRLIDEAIGRAIATLGGEDLLLVMSGYGMEPLSLGKRALERVIGDPELSGTHEGAPDGFLMAYGESVARSQIPKRASVVDVVPTLLYFLGLPIGRDMDGNARPDLFQAAFTADRPITFIPTYER